MKLENEFLCVEITGVGAEVTRIYDKTSDTEVLWNGDARFWKRHSPILFPNVGKTWNNSVSIDGMQYPTSQHGFARDTQFECVESAEDFIVFQMRSTEETKKLYPYDFELCISYRLNGKELDVEWRVKNCTEGKMYFTIGGHPAFAFAGKDEVKTDYCLRFPGKEKLDYLKIDLATGTGIPTPTYPMELKDGYHPLNEEMFEIDTFVFDESQIEEAWLCKKDGTPYVGVRCKDFPNFGIWSPAGAPFICLEPWCGRCDNYGFEGDISEKQNINCLTGGETFEKKYQIVVA